MLSTNRGFTLIEVLMAAAILVCGLVAAASVFSYVLRTNGTNRQMAIATSLLYDKMEQFRSTSFTDAIWTNTNGSEILITEGERYIRAWKVGPGVPRIVTVIVYAQTQTLTRRQT